MNARVNLLPPELQRRRRQRHRRRLWTTLCAGMIAVQVGAFLVADVRAREVRLQKMRADRLTASLTQESTERDALRAKAETIAGELRTAERFREKHHWSRWFASLGLIVPSQVVLTEVKTEPARFAAGTALVSAGTGPKMDDPGIRIIRISGAAMEHQGLIRLLEEMNGTRVFQSVTLEQARRERVDGREAIAFTLVCQW